MALPDLTGQNIENTYQRVLQTDGTNFYDGTGSAVSLGGSQNLQQVTEQGAITTIPITASIISASNNIIGGGLDISGPENSHIEVGTHIVGFDQFSFNTALITGSGLIISGTMADQNHHNFLKIGDIELVDVKTAFTPNTFLIHNVDDFAITSGSDGGNITTANLLFRHQGNAFDIYQNGVSKINMNANSDLTFAGDNITFAAVTATQMKATNTTATNTYILATDSNPTSTPQNLVSINAQDFFRTVNGAVTASVVSASNVSSDFSLFAHSASFDYISASTGDFDANTIRLGGTPFSKSDIDKLKSGKPISTDLDNLLVSPRDDNTFIRTSAVNRMALYAGNVPSIDIKNTVLTLGGLDGETPQTPVQIISPLTASSDISASGTIIANSITASIHGGTF